MSVEIIIPIAAVVLLLLIFAWLLKVFQASIKTILTIAAILIALQVIFGISSDRIIQEVMQIIEQIRQIIFS